MDFHRQQIGSPGCDHIAFYILYDLVFLPQQPFLNCPYFRPYSGIFGIDDPRGLKMENGKINPLQKRPPQRQRLSRCEPSPSPSPPPPPSPSPSPDPPDPSPSPSPPTFPDLCVCGPNNIEDSSGTYEFVGMTAGKQSIERKLSTLILG